MSDLTILYPDVLSTDDNAVERELLPDVHFEVYGARAASDVDDAVWASAQAMVTGIGMPIDEQVFEKATNLKVICRLGVGYDLIDVALAGRRGVRVCNVPDYGTAEVADHAMALLLAFTRGVVRYSEALRDDLENGWDYRLSPLQVRMRDKTIEAKNGRQVGPHQITRDYLPGVSSFNLARHASRSAANPPAIHHSSTSFK